MHSLYKKLAFVCFIIFFISACASQQQPVGYGTIISITKLKPKDYHPREETAVGAGIGAGSGALIGGGIATAGALGLTIVSFGLLAPAIPAIIATGAATGAATGGVAGGAIGYSEGLRKQGDGLYLFTVQLDNKNKVISITQYVKERIPLKTRVEVLLQKDRLLIHPIRRPSLKPQ